MIRELHCSNCGVELTGGLDTYGNPGQELCNECFSSGKMPPSERDEKLTEIENLKAQAQDVADQITDLELDYNNIMDDIWKLERDLGLHDRPRQPVVVIVDNLWEADA